ncbi:MAG: pyridoxamine 5'-phosphate oxidase family protein [Candidatus Saccharimonadales bacterium]
MSNMYPTPSVSGDRAKEIIEQVIYLNVATTDQNGQPWNTAVFSAYDEQYNLYWGSDKDAQHSQNIAANNKVFITVYDSTIPAGKGEGVYIQALAEEVTDAEEIKRVHALLQNRRPVPYWKLEQMTGEGAVRIYKAIPRKVWMNDEGEKGGDYVDKRTEVKL